MDLEIRQIARQQWPSGQFPTVVINDGEGWKRSVSTLTPTYLVCLFLTMLRERRTSSLKEMDEVIDKALGFLLHSVYKDPVEGVLSWRFNAYYPPDWEETCWCSGLLWQKGMLTRGEIEPLRRLIEKNTTPDKGVGVWVKDPYSRSNKFNNVFDPVVSLSVLEWHQRLFSASCEPTKRFMEVSLANDQPSLYYEDGFRNRFYSILGYGKTHDELLVPSDYRLFHHGRRTEVWYSSQAVWQALSLFMPP
jgi:hypothetical protein